jgi:hypothetical protein
MGFPQICHAVTYQYYWHVIVWHIWGNPITDMSPRGRFEEIPLLICHRVADFRGGFRGGAPGARPSPLKLEKIWFFGVKSWFFTRNTPKIFTPSFARPNFFKCTPLTWNPGSAPELCSMNLVLVSKNHPIRTLALVEIAVNFHLNFMYSEIFHQNI